METWKDFETRVNKIQPETKADLHVLTHLKAYLKMHSDPECYPTGWEEPKNLICTLQEECHDGAFGDRETFTPFLEFMLEDFISKYLPEYK